MGRRCFLILLVICVGDGAVAEPRAGLDAARIAFRAGQTEFQNEQYVQAIQAFKRAYQITNDPVVMGHVALAYERAGDYIAAKKALLIYRKALSKKEWADIRGILARYEVAIAADRSKAIEALEAKKTSVAKASPNDAGKGGQTKAAHQGRQPTADVPYAKKEGRHLWTWIAAGTAGALGVGALALGLNTQGTFDELKETCAPACSEADTNSVKTRAVAVDILWGAAAAAALTAVILYFVEGRNESQSRRVHVAPMLGNGTWGMGASLSHSSL
jgi:tetratricopeptide (TPR) repeat protein